MPIIFAKTAFFLLFAAFIMVTLTGCGGSGGGGKLQNEIDALGLNPNTQPPAAQKGWRWLNPLVLTDLSGVNLIYFFLVLSLTPLVTASGYFGGMLTFPLEAEAPAPGA